MKLLLLLQLRKDLNGQESLVKRNGHNWCGNGGIYDNQCKQANRYTFLLF